MNYLLMSLMLSLSLNAFSFEEKISENIEITCENIKQYDEFDILGFDRLTKSDGLDVYVAVFDFGKSVEKYKSILVISQFIAIDEHGRRLNTIFESNFSLTSVVNEGAKISITFDQSMTDRKSNMVYKYTKYNSDGYGSSYYRYFDLEKLKSCLI